MTCALGRHRMSVTVGPRRATPVGLTVPTSPPTPTPLSVMCGLCRVPRAKKASFSSLPVRRGRKPASAARPHGNPSDARDPTDTALRGLALPRASPRLITIAPTYTIPLNGHVTRSPIFNEARFREWTPFTTAIEAPSFPRAGVAHSRRSVCVPLVDVGIGCQRWVPTAGGWQRAWLAGDKRRRQIRLHLPRRPAPTVPEAQVTRHMRHAIGQSQGDGSSRTALVPVRSASHGSGSLAWVALPGRATRPWARLQLRRTVNLCAAASAYLRPEHRTS
jgi:hypothetical protein